MHGGKGKGKKAPKTRGGSHETAKKIIDLFWSCDRHAELRELLGNEEGQEYLWWLYYGRKKGGGKGPPPVDYHMAHLKRAGDWSHVNQGKGFVHNQW